MTTIQTELDTTTPTRPKLTNKKDTVIVAYNSPNDLVTIVAALDFLMNQLTENYPTKGYSELWDLRTECESLQSALLGHLGKFNQSNRNPAMNKTEIDKLFADRGLIPPRGNE